MVKLKINQTSKKMVQLLRLPLVYTLYKRIHVSVLWILILRQILKHQLAIWTAKQHWTITARTKPDLLVISLQTMLLKM